MLHEIDLTRADLNLLVLFEVIFEECHVGRAAERLRLSPSAVSHGLGRLRRLLNDPLFMRTPKGVVPNSRAVALAPAIGDALRRIRAVVAESEPFNPATSTRRLVIGAPDGVAAVFLQRLLSGLHRSAPGISLAVRHLLPAAGEADLQRAWRDAFTSLEAGALDIAVVPVPDAPVRFARRTLYREDFVLALRKGHAFLKQPTLDRYCAGQHLLVSESGDARGFIDEILEKHGRSRRVALTVPNFMFACAVVADSDLICALPRNFARMHAARFGIALAEVPLPTSQFELTAFLPAVSLADGGIKWFLERLGEAIVPAREGPADIRPARNPQRTRRRRPS